MYNAGILSRPKLSKSALQIVRGQTVVGIQETKDRRLCRIKTGSSCLMHIPRSNPEHAYATVFIVLGYLPGIVVGIIIDHDNFRRRYGLTQHTFNRFCQKTPIVVAGDDNRHL